ncbi:MAG TPA: chemotaxis protein CheR [Microscillaceae bacterium]|nr:chemotaxis protein CheR [Microscillaceae bacterium]
MPTIQNKSCLGQREFQVISEFIYTHFGILLPLNKKTLVEARLQKRLFALQMDSFQTYVDFVMGAEGQEEILHMIDRISTNKTSFFREWKHFVFLAEHLLPEHEKNFGNNPLKIWSSASSSGQECYSVAMAIEEYNQLSEVNIDYSILGSDISITVLQTAVDAVYKGKDLEQVPLAQRKRYFLRSKDKMVDKFRIAPGVRKKTNFQWLNLMDAYYNVPRGFDIIFCRNVLIYFDRKTQKEVISKLLLKLKSGGYLFLGHAESILDLNFPVKMIEPSVYQKIK